MEYILCPSKFPGRCGTINVNDIYKAAAEGKGFDCMDPEGNYHYLIPADECLKHLEAGEIEWKIIDGDKIINEVGFTGNRPNTGYGAFFEKLPLKRFR